MRCIAAHAALLLVLCPALCSAAEDSPLVEHSEPLPRGDRNTLGSRYYEPTEAEQARTKDWSEDELATFGATDLLEGDTGRRVSWFGIVRKVTEDKKANKTRMLVEMKFFDGLTDLHLQIVSIFGAGDFPVVIPGTKHKIEPLSLIRVYGKVVSEKEQPLVAAEFVRHWPQGQFAFMPYSEESDKTNPEWIKLRKVDPADIYSSDPDEEYYAQRLGKR